MEITREFLSVKFDEFNKQFFNYELKRPTLQVSRTTKVLGKCIQHRRGFNVFYTIQVTNQYKFDEIGYCNILIHEMIHLYIFQKALRDDSAHGKLFHLIAKRINNTSPYHISRYGNVSNVALANQKTHNVFILSLQNQLFVAVIAKTKVQAWKDVFISRNELKYILETNDERFNSFIKCTTCIRGKYINSDEKLKSYINSANKIIFDYEKIKY